jgi:hypothetical protein
MKAWMGIAVLLAGCGPSDSHHSSSGSSGIPSSKRLSELTGDEPMNLCYELADDFPERQVTCSDGETFSAGYTDSECLNEPPAPSTCMATAGDLRACSEAFYNTSDADLCASTELPDECVLLERDGCPL